VSNDTDVAIVGGGLAGVTVALRLAERGLHSVVLEKDYLNRAASGTNAGTLHFQLRRHDLRSPGRLELIRYAIDTWQALREQAGSALGAKNCGGLMVAENAQEVDALDLNLFVNRSLGLTVETVAGRALREVAPSLAPSVVSAIYCFEEGSVNPLAVGSYLARRARSAGVEIIERCEVSAISAVKGGFQLQHSKGYVRAGQLVNAAGAWSGHVAKLLGVPLPVHGVRQMVSVTERCPTMLGPILQHIAQPLTLKQTLDGTFLIGGGWPATHLQSGSLRGRIASDALAGNLDVACRLVPALRRTRLLRSWVGTVAVAPDRLPTVGRVDEFPGYHTLTVPRGAAGYTLTPYLAEQVALSMTGGVLPGNFQEFSPQRWL